MHAHYATAVAVTLLTTVACTSNTTAKADDASCPKEKRPFTLKAADLTFLQKVGPEALQAEKPVRVAKISGVADMTLSLACKAVTSDETRIHASCRLRGKTADGTAKVHSAPFNLDLLPQTPLQWGSAADVTTELVIKTNCGAEPTEE